MDNNPIIHAVIAVFLALGEAMGGDVLERAGDLIRDLLADDVVSPETADILESVLVGVDHNPTAVEPANILFVFEELATVH